jgi:hypothetical protein
MEHNVTMARDRKCNNPLKGGAVIVAPLCDYLLQWGNAYGICERQVHGHRVRIEIVERNRAVQKPPFPAMFGAVGDEPGTPFSSEPRIKGRAVARDHGQCKIVPP